ncbi:rCG23825, partial [Rattus norvegicus]
MDSMRTSLRRPHPPVVLGSAPPSSASPLSWLLPLPSILEGAPKSPICIATRRPL